MPKPFILTTPASRGIGLALTRLALQQTSIPVIATARTDVGQTKKMILSNLEGIDPDRLHVLELDVTHEASISNVNKQIPDLLGATKDDPLQLRLAFAIPGILHPEKSPSKVDYEDALMTFKVNTLGPLMLMKHLAQYLPRKKDAVEEINGLPSHAIWGTMSARVGSTSQNELGGWYSYRSSKAAVNALTKSFDIYLQGTSGNNAMAIALHPGTVKTDLSKDFWSGVPKGKLFEPAQAARYLWDVAMKVGLEGRGKCWDWEGKEIPP